MCFHWCSACGMLQTGMGKEKRQKASFSFFNSILPVRGFSGSVYSFISRVRLRPVRRDACSAAADAAALWQDWTPATLSFFHSSLSHLLTPPLTPSPFSLSHSLAQVFVGK